MKLKNFQSKTVAAVLAGLKNGAYALADETGLGKTVVCGDVARALVEGHPKQDMFVVYYVAPSIELLVQNLDSITKHLDDQLTPAGSYHVHKVISRVTQIPLALAKREMGKKNVFVVGLTPETSFKITGPGKMDERAYLAALFGIHCSEEMKSTLSSFFWCLSRPMDEDFANRVAAYTSRDMLGALYQWRKNCGEEYGDFAARIRTLCVANRSTRKDRRKIVTQVRKSIAAFLVRSEETLPDLVVFDEWHKYKATCFEQAKNTAPHERLVSELLAALRRARRSKVLFVSATPFTVDYGDLQDGSGTATSSDLRSLIRLFWDKERFEVEYQSLSEKQAAFVAAIEKMLRYNLDDDLQALRTEAGRRCQAYEAELRRYCVRTERPKVPPPSGKDLDVPQWDPVFQSGSAKEFLRRFSRLRDVRSPVTAMWMDGHTFPEAGYDGLKAHTIRNIPKEHWKIRRLQAVLKGSLNFQDRLHSLDRPPLWLWPEEQLRGRKHLIFSEFRFVPEEICTVLKRLHSKVRDTASYSGSVLGFFPLASNRYAQTIGEKNLGRSIHFPLFYPFLFWELDPVDLAERVSKHREALGDLIAHEQYAVPTILAIEALLVQGNSMLRQPMAARRTLMRADHGIRSSARFREYVTAIIDGNVDAWAPGRVVARVVGQQRSRRQEKAERQKDFEEKALQLGETLFHLFVTPEAQVLKRHAQVSQKKLPKAWNAFLRFALWYTNRYHLLETLQQFAGVLATTGQDGLDVLTEMVASMSLKRGSVGTKFIRSFHDRKAEEPTGANDSVTVSTQSLRAAFNSPFAPYVLASTSVGQEGLDFHRYCDSIIHWTPPGSPSALRQREGRLDRFRSLQVRIALQQLERNGQTVDDDGYDGLSPDFVVMNNGGRLNRHHSEVLYLPFTVQQATWQRCLARMHYDDLLIGAPDPLADEQVWLNAIDEYKLEDRSRRFALLKEFSISLRPKSGC